MEVAWRQGGGGVGAAWGRRWGGVEAAWGLRGGGMGPALLRRGGIVGPALLLRGGCVGAAWGLCGSGGCVGLHLNGRRMYLSYVALVDALDFVLVDERLSWYLCR